MPAGMPIASYHRNALTWFLYHICLRLEDKNSSSLFPVYILLPQTTVVVIYYNSG